jgi:hypothetical protein
MAGSGSQLYTPHDVLKGFSPDRFSAKPIELAVCIDHITSVVSAESLERPNVSYALGKLAGVREALEDEQSYFRKLPIIARDDINFHLTHNLVGAVPAVEEV